VSNIPAASTFELNGDTLYASRSIDPNIEGDGSVGAILGGDPTHRRPSPTRRSTECGKRSSPTGTRIVVGHRLDVRESRAAQHGRGVRSRVGPSLDPPPGTSTETFAPEGLLSMNPGSDGGQTVPECSASRARRSPDTTAMASSLKLGGLRQSSGGVDGAVIENNTFDLGVASDTLTGTTQPIVIDADQGSTTTSVLISGNSVTTNGIGAEASLSLPRRTLPARVRSPR